MWAPWQSLEREKKDHPDCLGTALVRDFRQVKAQVKSNQRIQKQRRTLVEPKLARHLNTVLECLGLGSSARVGEVGK